MQKWNKTKNTQAKTLTVKVFPKCDITHFILGGC